MSPACLPTCPPAAVANNNDQTRAIFSAEADVIAARQLRLSWLAPSRDENVSGTVFQDEEPDLWIESVDDPSSEPQTAAVIQGGRERGLVLHKLMEEVLTSETVAAKSALVERAADLICALGRSSVDDSATGLSATELAGCVTRTLTLPEISALRSELVPEFPVYGVRRDDGAEAVITGIADAMTLTKEGRPSVIVDWKSDVNPNAATLDHYRDQVRSYIGMTNAERGLIVLLTTGVIITILPAEAGEQVA